MKKHIVINIIGHKRNAVGCVLGTPVCPYKRIALASLLAANLAFGAAQLHEFRGPSILEQNADSVEMANTFATFGNSDIQSQDYIEPEISREEGARYLIITHDDFYNAVLPLAEWKHKKGMMSKVVKLSETGSSSAEIKSYIVNAYNTWQTRPEFLLLVGAPSYIPFGYIDFVYTDNFYTNIEGDIFNEILSGRITAHTETEAQTVVNKILLYERTPFMTDTSWFKDACLIAREDYTTYPPIIGDDSIYWDDIHHAKNHLENNHYQTIDTLSKLLGDNAEDIVAKVDSGRAFVLYRGSGVSNWWDPFDVVPDVLNNGAKLPIVLSITCRTIATGYVPSIAEKWLLTGTPTEPRGASGYFATTTVISDGAYLRSAVCKGFFDGLFQQGKKTFGEACEEGRKRVYNMYGNTWEYMGFTTLGDPEMNIWTKVPQNILVFHEGRIYNDDDSLHVRVESGNEPLEPALACIRQGDLIYDYGYTSSQGDITFYFDTLELGMMDITVTGRNMRPYEGTIEVIENTGVKEHELKSLETKFRAFPTITRNYVNVSGTEQVDVYDVTGKKVGSYRINDTQTVNLSKYPAGIYFIKPKDNNVSIEVIKPE